ncbi:SIR2 family protein [Macrococcus brunensis]|uniref:SIR2 family protein n=1 Tax=Macrococcus brunensis TaxID=198483 RepID=UPI001EEFB451|nr:SIR2 family protein [Macrococcus brunensis]ULG71494.1 SIR2 family protein [Macrococcus brunensis]
MNLTNFIREYSDAVKKGDAAIFAGAGTSIDSGYVNWKGLLKPFAEELDLDIEKEHDLIGIAQYYLNHKRNRASINQKILNAFTKDVETNETIKVMTKLPIETYWTTNYDSLIEDGLKANNRKPDIKITEEDLALNIKDRDAIVYKMHGDKNSPYDAVLVKDDYEMYDEKRSLFTTSLRADLISKTFLFIGFSFEDPNLERILAKIKILIGSNSRTHYYITKEVSKEDYLIDGVLNEEEYLYDSIKQKLKIEDLKRYGIETILIEQYTRIPEILESINQRLLTESIFISGSISQYSERWSEAKVNELCFNLANSLLKNNYRIVSGFGLGVGSNIINGALQQIYSDKYQNVNDYLKLFPFPQSLQNKNLNIKDAWTDYRRMMISNSGICIFIFGNKLVDGKYELANGMQEEFDIALKLNKKVIPVPTTCNMSEKLFDNLERDGIFPSYLKEYKKRLKNTDDKKLVDLLIEIIKKLQG